MGGSVGKLSVRAKHGDGAKLGYATLGPELGNT
jgi:hypothetical protein